jgi:hypothetical protein
MSALLARVWDRRCPAQERRELTITGTCTGHDDAPAGRIRQSLSDPPGCSSVSAAAGDLLCNDAMLTAVGVAQKFAGSRNPSSD